MLCASYRQSLCSCRIRPSVRRPWTSVVLSAGLLKRRPGETQSRYNSTDPISKGASKGELDVPILTESINGRRRNYFYATISRVPSQAHPSSSIIPQPAPDIPPLGMAWEWAQNGITSRKRFRHVLPGMGGWFRAMFLPVGYPSSVHPAYAKVHVYQFLETFVWSTVSVLCSQAMLESIGVGSTAAAAGTAVAVQWVLKDGIGEVGKLFFIQRFAHSFDAYPKTWKLVGELSSLSGAFLQLCTIISPSSWFLPLASAGYALRSIHYSIWNATHMTFTRNFALQGNVGDLVAKDDSQMSVAHLLGMLSGVTAISISHAPLFLFGGFLVLGPVHFAMSMALLRAAQFEVLNETTLTLISRQYVKDLTVPGMEDLAPYGRWFGERVKKGENVVKIRVGVPAKVAFKQGSDLSQALQVLKNENYLLTPTTSPHHPFDILLHTEASPHDVCKAILHATRLYHDLEMLINSGSSDQIDAIGVLDRSHKWTVEHFPKYIAEVDFKGWQSDAVFWGDTGNRVEWERPQAL